MVEVGLTRIFSFTYWYHFAYLLISVALLGVGAAGSFLTAYPRLREARLDLLLSVSSMLAAAGCLLILAAIAGIRLSPADLLHGRANLTALGFLYLILLIPFFFTGLMVVGLLSRFPRQTARIYCFDLAGAGLGCLLVVQSFWLVGGIKTILFASGLYVLAAGLFLRRVRSSRALTATCAAAFVILISWIWRSNGDPFQIPPAKDKALYNLLQTAGGPNIEYTRWSPICRVDVLGWKSDAESRKLGMLTLWGMSRRFQGTFPAQKYFAQDGDACTSMYQYRGDPREMEFLNYNTLRIPYLFVEHPNVLIIGLGGATDVRVAVVNEAAHITGVDINPIMVDLVANRYREWTGALYQRNDVTIRVDEGRSFARRTTESYDLIQMTGVDTLAALSSGAYILSESYLYTAEAMQDLLHRLKPGGFLTLTIAEEDLNFGGTDPGSLRAPRFTTRLLAILEAALEREGVGRPADHWLVVTNEQPVFHTKMVSILTKKTPLTAAEIGKYRAFVDSMGFESWYHPGIESKDSPLARFIGFDREQRERFFSRSYLNMRPTTDDAPFFFNYYKWSSLFRRPELQEGRPARSYAEGQVVLVVMLLQGLIFSIFLIGLPLLRLRRKSSGLQRRSGYFGMYFAALGLGFIFVEIGAIQQFTLFLGYPTYALSCVLAAMLVFSGLGSLGSGRVGEARLVQGIVRSLVYFFGLILLLAWVYPRITTLLLAEALPLRVAVSTAMLAPFGLVMGRFLPLGLRLTDQMLPEYVPWAWAINGCCSVVGTTLAVILAISIGFRGLFLVSLFIYCAGVVALVRGAGLSAQPAVAPRI